MTETSVFSNKRRKIVQPTSGFALMKCHRRYSFPEDRISELPDEVLVSILSSLTTEEAIRTSILARRWRYLWKSIDCFEFSDISLDEVLESESEDCYHGRPPQLKAGRVRFANGINQVLKSHKGKKIDVFKFFFGVNNEYFRSDIDGWINFAFQKRVKRLWLDFTCSWVTKEWRYTLTTQFLCNYDLKCLTTLSLFSVEVTGEVVEHILSTCPSLEVLKVDSSASLVILKVSGPSLMLKHLFISYCLNVKSLEVHASKLLSFQYHGMPTSITYQDVRNLAIATFRGSYANFIIHNISHISTLLSQLETLILDLDARKPLGSPKLSTLSNLKQLELKFTVHSLPILHFCATLLMASPILQRLTLKFIFWGMSIRKESIEKRKMQVGSHTCLMEVREAHKCLKVVELVGFFGCKFDLEPAVYIIRHAASLEKVIVDFRCPYGFVTCDAEERAAREIHVRQHLEPILPPGAKLLTF